MMSNQMQALQEMLSKKFTQQFKQLSSQMTSISTKVESLSTQVKSLSTQMVILSQKVERIDERVTKLEQKQSPPKIEYRNQQQTLNVQFETIHKKKQNSQKNIHNRQKKNDAFKKDKKDKAKSQTTKQKTQQQYNKKYNSSMGQKDLNDHNSQKVQLKIKESKNQQQSDLYTQQQSQIGFNTDNGLQNSQINSSFKKCNQNQTQYVQIQNYQQINHIQQSYLKQDNVLKSQNRNYNQLINEQIANSKKIKQNISQSGGIEMNIENIFSLQSSGISSISQRPYQFSSRSSDQLYSNTSQQWNETKKTNYWDQYKQQGMFSKSIIASCKQDQVKIKNLFIPRQIKKASLLFQARKNNFNTIVCDQLCKSRPNTLIMCQSISKKVIGGYTPFLWGNNKNESEQIIKDINQKSFLFSLTNNDVFDLKLEFNKIQNINVKQFYRQRDFLNIGQDLIIKNGYRQQNYSILNLHFNSIYSNQKYYEQNISGINYNLLVGEDSSNVKCTQWQVWQLEF